MPRLGGEKREKPAEGPSMDARVHSTESYSLPEATTVPPANERTDSSPVTADQPPLSPEVPLVLKPPVLLTVPSHADGTGGYQIVLERGDLAPQLKAHLLEGRVVLRILVLANGMVDRSEVAETSGQAALDQAAVTAARSWRFDPATRDGTPIDAWVLIPVRFVTR